MASKFIVRKKPIEVELHYLENDGDIILILGEELIKAHRDKLKTMKAKFHRPNNKTFNTSITGCIKTNENGANYIDKAMFDDRRFRIHFIEAIDGDGEKIGNNPNDIDNLMTEVVNALLELMDQKLEEEKIEILKTKGLLDSSGNLVKEKENKEIEKEKEE